MKKYILFLPLITIQYNLLAQGDSTNLFVNDIGPKAIVNILNHSKKNIADLILPEGVDDTIFILKPSNVYSFNLQNNTNYTAGQKFYLDNITSMSESVIIIDSENNSYEISCTLKNGGNNDLDYFFWPQKRANNIKKKYGNATWKTILNGIVKIGWSKSLCELSWGFPNDINKTLSAGGIHEQWVYSGGYLYFENGKLTTIQN